jgi:cytidylate kinase
MCAAREQAVRFIEREAGKEQGEEACKLLPLSAAEYSVADVVSCIRRLRTLSEAERDRLCAAFADNVSRDEDDRRRFASLYGSDPVMDYRHSALYDVFINTTHNTSQQTFTQTMQALQQHLSAQENTAFSFRVK